MALRTKFVSGLTAIAVMFIAFGLTEARAQQGNVPMADLLVEGPLADVWLGDEDAPVVIIEYASMTCPHCADFHNTVFDDLVAKYVNTGLVRFTIREFPLDSRAAAANMLARCVPEDSYYALIDLLFEQQSQWAPAPTDIFLDTLFGLVRSFGFTLESFGACITDETLYGNVLDRHSRGDELGVDGTPTFFINGARFGGVLTLEQLDRIMEPML